ncbi:hypothetical protein ACLB2K_019296 [Fragaria x ananassa]
MVKKRYLGITEDSLKANPNICTYKPPSLDARQDLLIHEVPKLGKEAALKAIREWGHPISSLTHLIFCTASCVDMPVRSDRLLDVLVGQVLFSDGAAALIVGANPDPKSECQLFNVMSVREAIIPNSEHGVVAHLREMGFEYYLSSEVPNIHPGGPAILDKVEEQLGLKEGKLRATRHVLSEFGNMGAPSVPFILDELRKKSMEEGKATTGEGLEWGVLIGIGPGLTVETVVLRSAPANAI